MRDIYMRYLLRALSLFALRRLDEVLLFKGL